MNINKGKNKNASRVENLITGTSKRFPNASATLAFGNTTRTVAEVTQLLQSFVTLRDAVIASQAAAKEKVAAERAQAPALIVVIDEFVSFVRATFGNSPEALADFGLSPRKAKKPLTAEQAAVAAAKRNATRAKRNTMGSVQRKAVKGEVQVTITTTPVKEVPVATPPAPSGNAPNGGGTPGTPHA